MSGSVLLVWEAAELLRISRQRVHELVKQRRIRVVGRDGTKLGRLLLDRDSVERFAQERKAAK